MKGNIAKSTGSFNKNQLHNWLPEKTVVSELPGVINLEGAFPGRSILTLSISGTDEGLGDLEETTNKYAVKFVTQSKGLIDWNSSETWEFGTLFPNDYPYTKWHIALGEMLPAESNICITWFERSSVYPTYLYFATNDPNGPGTPISEGSPIRRIQLSKDVTEINKAIHFLDLKIRHNPETGENYSYILYCASSSYDGERFEGFKRKWLNNFSYISVELNERTLEEWTITLDEPLYTEQTHTESGEILRIRGDSPHLAIRTKPAPSELKVTYYQSIPAYLKGLENRLSSAEALTLES